MKKLWIITALLILIGGAASIASSKQKPERAPYEGCTWHKIHGAGLSIWAQKCDFKNHDMQMRVAADEVLPGYAIELKAKSEDAFSRSSEVIQVFKINTPGDIYGLLPKVTIDYRDIPFPGEAACAFERSTSMSIPGKARYLLAPTGKTKAAYELAAASKPDEIPNPPCGRYGIDADSTRYFEIQDSHPDTILFIDMGQEDPFFDENSIEIL